MAHSIIRSFTESDKERLNESALRFVKRHSLEMDLDGLPTLSDAVDWHVLIYEPKLKPLWQACKCRALKVPVAAGIAVSYGYIGYTVN